MLVPAQDSPVAGRPLVNLSFAINYAADGLDVRGYHVVNIALHAVCTVLVFVVVRGVLGANLALAIALLWAVHPLNSEVVNYLSQRTESMMAAFYLLTLYAAIRAADAARPTRWHVLAIVACWLGALCKESIATAPLVVALYDRIFHFDSWKAAVARRKFLYGGLAATWLLVGVGVASGARSAVAGFSSGVSPWTYLLNQSVMITEYLRLSVWPDRLVVFYGWPLPLTFGDVAPYVLFIALLAAVTAAALFKTPRLGFLGAFFFITLAPTSSVIPIATEVGADRRMYLPLLAVVTVVAVAANAGLRRVVALRVIPVILVVVASVALAATTVARNREYQSNLTLARTIVERRPTGGAYHMLGEQLLAEKKTEEGIRHLREAVSRGNSRAGYQLGIALYNEGQYAEAIAQLEAFVKSSERGPLVPRWLDPTTQEIVLARLAIGRARVAQQEWRAAAEQATLALTMAPGHTGAHLLMADAAFGEQRWNVAESHYREYLQRQPADARALINYGITQIAAEQLDEAIAAFRRATELDPADARARRLLALAQQDRARLAGR